MTTAVMFTALTVGVVAAGGDPLPGDDALHLAVLHHRPPVARRVAQVVTASGTGVWPYLLALIAGLVTGRGRPDRLRRAALAVAVLAAGQAVRYGLMAALARPRPEQSDWAAHASGWSFPSGHSTTSALAAGLLCWAFASSTRRALARLTLGLALVWALAVGLTRIYLGVHWASDVLAGWLLATTWLALLAALLSRTRHPLAAVAP
ncbi:phosphatase PAP2 family protein [Streptomyces sp. NPDC059740]|uniref:phosphatase PAP2 family protein n=1 Tax=Streptomyces sp. NPDC059740 TaxID=3346926 RepID=UPI00365229AD